MLVCHIFKCNWLNIRCSFQSDYLITYIEIVYSSRSRQQRTFVEDSSALAIMENVLYQAFADKLLHIRSKIVVVVSDSSSNSG